MKERISVQELIALNSTPQAKALIIKYGYSPAKNYKDLSYKLFRFTKDFKEDALKELSAIHPHKDLILNYNSNPIIEDKKSNFDGSYFGHGCQCRECRLKRILANPNQMLSFEGELTEPKVKEAGFSTMIPTLIIAGLVSTVLVVAIRGAR